MKRKTLAERAGDWAEYTALNDRLNIHVTEAWLAGYRAGRRVKRGPTVKEVRAAVQTVVGIADAEMKTAESDKERFGWRSWRRGAAAVGYCFKAG